MTVERSHGKARPQLPRARNLQPSRTARVPDGKREHDGRFGKGNDLARGRGWKRAIVRMLGRLADDLPTQASNVAADAWRIFTATIREMPHDGPTVRALVARMARHEALEAYWGARALAALGTAEGDEADKRATLHGQRAERLAVTALDVARTIAETERNRPSRPWRAPSAANSHAAPSSVHPPVYDDGAAQGDSADVDSHGDVGPSRIAAPACVGDTHDDARRVQGPPSAVSDRESVNRFTAARPQLAPHLAELNATNPAFAELERQHDARMRDRRKDRR